MKKLLVTVSLSAPFLVSAALFTEFSEVVDKFCVVLNWVYTAAIVVGIASILLAAFKYITARGDSEKISEGHKALTYAVVGIAIAILAAGVPFIVGDVLGAKDEVAACPGQG